MDDKKEVGASSSASSSAAALLACGIGCAALGLLVTLSEVIEPLKDALNIYPPVGPLSGKTTVACCIWLAAWIALANTNCLKGRWGRWVTRVSVTLILVGLLGTFPPVYWFAGALFS